MSALPRFALRPLCFPSHRFGALVDLSTGRVVAVRPLADLAASGDTNARQSGSADPRVAATGAIPHLVSAGGNAHVPRVCLVTLCA